MTGNDIAVLLAFMAAAVALAGFSGLVTSIDRRSVSVASPVISLQVGALLVSSMALAFLCLLPIVLDAFGVARDTPWRLACAAYAFIGAGIIISVVATRRRMRGGAARGFSQGLLWGNVAIGTVSDAAAIAGALSIISARGAFLLSLCNLLYQTFAMYYRMVRMADEGASAATGAAQQAPRM